MNPATYTIEKLTVNDAKWYGYNGECFIVRFKGFAPLERFAKVVNGKYSHNEKTGYIHGNGNLGTSSILLKNLNTLNTL